MSPVYAGIFLVSAAMLLFELTLTRLFSVTQWYHFAFISVSVALLGSGASGTWLALRPAPQRERGVPHRLAGTAVLFSASLLVAYMAINYVPFDSYRIALERRQLLYLVLYYIALILPFFFAGLCVGLALVVWPDQANTVYAANLVGSAVGSLMVLALVPRLGGEGAAISASAMAAVAAVAFTFAIPSIGDVDSGRSRFRLACLLLLLAIIALLLNPPGVFNLRLSPYKALSRTLLFPGASIVFTEWNAFSRVDVVQGAGIHSAPGLSLFFAEGLPKQYGLLVDGANLSPVTCLQRAGDERMLHYLPAALPYVLRPGASALIIEPRGGMDILAALYSGASSVLALESNPLVVKAVRELGGVCGPVAYDDPRATVVTEEPRSYLQRSAERFDVIVLSLADTYQPVISGVYSLSESYAYTVEAMLSYLAHLKEDGILVITRWVQTPPSEELRACALLAEALGRATGGDPEEQIVAFRSWSTATLLAKSTPFTAQEIEGLKGFCRERGFDLIHYLGMPVSEANRYNVLPDTLHYDTFQRVLSDPAREPWLMQYPYEVSPPTDDRPFFFHFFRWGQTSSILQSLGKTWQPFGGSGYLILVALLVLAVLLSGLLIVLPLAVRSAPALPGSQWVLMYFVCLGLGYLLVEMPLLQQFILFLGQPTYSFSLVLFSILLFSGLGSVFSGRLPLRATLGFLLAVLLAYPLLLPRLFALSMGWSLPLRVLTAVLGLGPLGFLMGMPMPAGIRLLETRAPRLIPWAWAVNGCASVISSILAVMGAISLGSSRVLIAGAVAYGVAWLTAAPLSQIRGQAAV